MTIKIKFKKLVPEAKLPTKGKPGDAAYDLYCIEKFELLPGQTKKVRTGLQLADMPLEDGPDLLFLQIEGRSGVASNGVYPLGGVVAEAMIKSSPTDAKNILSIVLRWTI
jgi:dUTPase